MNKLDTLRNYIANETSTVTFTNEDGTTATATLGECHVLAAWKAQGSLKVSSDTSYFNEGMLYYIQKGLTSDENLRGGIIYCKSEYVGALNWKNAQCVNVSKGYIEFETDIISPNLILILPGTSYSNIDTESDAYTEITANFVPFKQNDTGNVSIPEADYELCLRPLGYPYITEDELEYTREQINNLAIKPALEEYFKWFPKVSISTYDCTTSSTQEIQYPDDAYDVVHFDIQQGGASIGSGAIRNTLWRSMEDGFYGIMSNSSITGSYYSGISAPTTSTSMPGSYLTSRAAIQGLINYSTRTDFQRYRKDDGNWYIKFYSTKGGVAEVHWALKTHDFTDVEFTQRNNVIKLCSANIKKLFADLRRQAATNIPGRYDYDKWESEAKEDYEAVITEWKSIVRWSGSVLRGSL